MAKKKINFKLTDGMKPRKSEAAGKPFELRLPMDVRIGPNSTQDIKLGLSCEQPVAVVRGGVMKFIAPGEVLSVTIQNMTTDVVVIGQGEVVAKAFIFDNSDCEVT